MIKKTSETRPLGATVVNQYDDSQINAYSTEYINDMNTYSETEIDTGKKWIDGKTIYQKTIKANGPITNNGTTAHGITNLDSLITYYGHYKSADGVYNVPVPTIFNSVNYQFGINALNSTNVVWTVGGSISITSSMTVYVTLEYTKTS